VSNSDFSELAGTTTHGILVAVDARSGIEDWSKSTIWIVRLLVYQLVVGIGIAGWLLDSIADAL
jgi:hypothetical protein